MSFKSQIEQGLEQIQQMQELYRQVRDAEILPLSFFSTSYDTLKSLAVALHEMESYQLDAMLEQSSKHETMFAGISSLLKKPEQGINTDDFVTLDTMEEEPPVQPVAFLSDIIGKQLSADLRKLISLNDRFRFQRDLFAGNAGLMDETLGQLNELASLNDSLIFLNDRFVWNWEETPASDFRVILEKRFL